MLHQGMAAGSFELPWHMITLLEPASTNHAAEALFANTLAPMGTNRLPTWENAGKCGSR
jgi:hypothetical protein